MESLGNWIYDKDEQYRITYKTNDAANATRAWGQSMWAKAKSALAKKSSTNVAAGAEAQA